MARRLWASMRKLDSISRVDIGRMARAQLFYISRNLLIRGEAAATTRPPTRPCNCTCKCGAAAADAELDE